MIVGVRAISPDARVGIRIHNARGIGIANVYPTFSMGVDLFESSVTGLGGCPFANHGNARAADDVCTENGVFICHELSIETGVDLEKQSVALRRTEKVIGSTSMGRVMHSGSMDNHRCRTCRSRPGT